MAKVVIYTTNYCPYCFRAKALLRSKDVEFEEIDVTDDPDRRAEMERLSGRRTVPQIFIDAQPIGGYYDWGIGSSTGELRSTKLKVMSANQPTRQRSHFGATRQTTSAVRTPAPTNDARPKGQRT